MRWRAKSRNGQDAGAALIIAIFALMLVSVVAIALVVSTGTDSNLAVNYRTASGAYYASLAGLEEARGRLLWKNPDFLNNSGTYTHVLFDNSGALPQWGLSQVVYIVNPGPGENVSSILTTYPDTEYAQEFPAIAGSAVITQFTSTSGGTGIPGPSYKWVRINAITQQALNIDVNGTGSGTSDGVDLLYYDPAHVNPSNPSQPAPSLVVGQPMPSQPTPTAVQALEVTAYAVLPGGGTRLLQYVVAPFVISPDALDMDFPAALTLDNGQFGSSSSVVFTAPTNYQIKGVDSCNPPASPVASVAYTSAADQSYLFNQMNTHASDFPGAPLSGPPNPNNPTTPSLQNTSAPNPILLRQSWLTPATLDAVMQDIVNSADVTLGPSGTYFTGSPQSFQGQDLWNAAPALTSGTAMTIVVNGNLTLNGENVPNAIGSGLLLVTGTLNFHPSATWNGIILVVGQGQVVVGGSLPPSNPNYGLNGSMFVAQTRNSSGNLLPNLTASYTYPGNGLGDQIQYNSCVVKSASGPLVYKVLSFHEIPLPNS